MLLCVPYASTPWVDEDGCACTSLVEGDISDGPLSSSRQGVEVEALGAHTGAGGDGGIDVPSKSAKFCEAL